PRLSELRGPVDTPPVRSGNPWTKPAGITGERWRRIAVIGCAPPYRVRAPRAWYRRAMIPYDDLVIALATWRARQGLPVAQLSGSLTPPPPVPDEAPVPRSSPPAPPRPGF